MPASPSRRRGPVWHLFGEPSGLLGRIGGVLMVRRSEPAYQWVLGVLDVGETDEILELGFGPGRLLQLLAQAARKGHAIGVDPSPVMVAQARRRNEEAVRSGQVRLYLAPAERLPVSEASVDKIVAMNTIDFWPDRAAALNELRRVGRVGSMLAVIVRLKKERAGRLDPSAHGWSRSDLARLESDLAEARFEDATTHRHELGNETLAAVVVRRGA